VCAGRFAVFRYMEMRRVRRGLTFARIE